MSLQEWVSEDFGIPLASIDRITHGADTSAEVWRGVAADGSQYAVKWSGGGTNAGPLVTAHLANDGVPGVLAPMKTRSGQLWSRREGRRLSVMPWISGTRAAETGLTAQQWTSYGELPAKVHATESTATLSAVLPRLNPINARMPALTRSIERRLTTEPPADAIETELATVWQDHQQTITGLLELADKLEPPQAKPVICHADPHLGNVLVEPTRIHLIDWDDAVLAPPEQDLMFMLGGMGSLGPTAAEHLEAFFDGYGNITLDENNLTYHRCARALEDVALWSDQVLQGPDREDSLEILRGVLSPDGLAVRALS